MTSQLGTACPLVLSIALPQTLSLRDFLTTT